MRRQYFFVLGLTAAISVNADSILQPLAETPRDLASPARFQMMTTASNRLGEEDTDTKRNEDSSKDGSIFSTVSAKHITGSAEATTSGTAFPSTSLIARVVGADGGDDGGRMVAFASSSIDYQVVVVPLIPTINLAALMIKSAGRVSASLGGGEPSFESGRASIALKVNNRDLGSATASKQSVPDPRVPESDGFDVDETFLARANMPIAIRMTASAEAFGSVGGEFRATDARAFAFIDPIITLAPESQPYFQLVFSPNLTPAQEPVPEPKSVFLTAVGIALVLIPIVKARKQRAAAQHVQICRRA